MTYDVYRYIFIGGAGLAALCFVIAIILFFVLRIPRVIGDLSGSTARKAIANIRNQNENSGDKTYKSSAVNRQRGKLTDKITDTGKLVQPRSNEISGAMPTTKISTSRLESEARESYETSLLDDSSGETTVLDSGYSNETTVLPPETTEAFTVEYELTFIHTDEFIA